MEAYERDCLWLKSRFPVVSESDIELFCEKVAVFSRQYRLSDTDSREKSLGLLTEKWALI
jgi:hypothetical protein